ncbi:hypothetical protein IWQ60_011186, partial [Tieghemiomyces parasiticus]
DAATTSTTAHHRTHRYSLGTYPNVAPPRYHRQATTDSAMSNDSDTSLPDYVCTIQREGRLEMKMEFDDNDTRSKHRVWRTRYVQLWGTCLRIYAKKPRSPEDTLPLHNINMQKVQAGLALDYHKKRHVFRVHADGLQFLLQGVSSMEMIYWIDALQASANIALPIEERLLSLDTSAGPHQNWLKRGEVTVIPGQVRPEFVPTKTEVAAATADIQALDRAAASLGLLPTDPNGARVASDSAASWYAVGLVGTAATPETYLSFAPACQLSADDTNPAQLVFNLNEQDDVLSTEFYAGEAVRCLISETTTANPHTVDLNFTAVAIRPSAGPT